MEEQKINNKDFYTNEMSKAIEDKLWFTKFLRGEEFKNSIIIDYGCSDGTLIRELENIFTHNFYYFGVDIDKEILEVAAKKSSPMINTYYLSNVPQLVSYGRPKSLILSSVLHEVFSYGRVEKFKEELEGLDPDYIFIRDMMLREDTKRKPMEEDINKISRHSLFESFQHEWGMKSQKDLIHFLLKYRYETNWEREVKENYVILQEQIDNFNQLFQNYEVTYKKRYLLPFVREQVKKDFEIDLKDETHINLILRKK